MGVQSSALQPFRAVICPHFYYLFVGFSTCAFTFSLCESSARAGSGSSVLRIYCHAPGVTNGTKGKIGACSWFELQFLKPLPGCSIILKASVSLWFFFPFHTPAIPAAFLQHLPVPGLMGAQPGQQQHVGMETFSQTGKVRELQGYGTARLLEPPVILLAVVRPKERGRGVYQPR